MNKRHVTTAVAANLSQEQPQTCCKN